MNNGQDEGGDRKALFGIFDRRFRWGLSIKAKLLALLFSAGAFALVWYNIYIFFAVSRPVTSDLLAVEGWVPDYAIRAAASEYRSGGYRMLLTTGGPVQGMGGYVNDYSTAASIGATRLRALGFTDGQLQMVPSRVLKRDRTYASAIALKEWLAVHFPAERRINVMTTDVHARRTRLLFQLALGRDFSVGIIAIPNPDYKASEWWRYSEGVRDVLGETIAYVYAKFFFYP